jgi:hypothetical protein
LESTSAFEFSTRGPDDDDDDDVYLEYYSGKGFHINYSVYMSYVKHIDSSNKV